MQATYAVYALDEIPESAAAFPGFRLTPSHLFLFRCANPSDLFVNARALPLDGTDASPHCLGIDGACTPDAALASLSNPTAGRCACLYPHNGTYCQDCVDGTGTTPPTPLCPLARFADRRCLQSPRRVPLAGSSVARVGVRATATA